MSKMPGRKATVQIESGGNWKTICAVRTKTLTINNQLIDASDDCSGGMQVFLDEVALQSVSLSLEGVYSSGATELLDLALSNNVRANLKIVYPDYEISGEFVIENYSEGLPHNEIATFTADFNSSGAIFKSGS